MTWDGVKERRRTPRVDMGGQVDCSLELRARVRLVDISASGALLASETTLPLQASGRLRAKLDAAPFTSTLEVRRIATPSGLEGTQLGTIFLGMDDDSRRSLDAFLKKATA
jgi:c-di-GMP-binding flagellar brake protein YcgR